MRAFSKRVSLKPGASAEIQKVHGQLKSVHEFLQDTLDALGGKDGLQPITSALNEAAPWAGVVVNAVAESLPPVKFVLKLFEGAVKVEDPNELGLLACTLAFQRAVQQAVPEVIGMLPPSRRVVARALPGKQAQNYDFSEFSWESPCRHPFVVDATPWNN